MRADDAAGALIALAIVVVPSAVLLTILPFARLMRRPFRRLKLRWRSEQRQVAAVSLAAPPTSMPPVQQPIFRPAPPPPPAATPAPPAVVPPPRPAPAGPRLPGTTVVDCRSNAALFYGWCASPSGTGRMDVRGAAWRGGLHCANGTDGQDVTGAAWDPETGVLYVAVADGLGSLPESGRLAREVVRATLHLCLHRPDRRPFAEVGPQLFKSVLDGLHRKLGPGVAADAGTTLVVAELRPTERGTNLTVHGVGDSEAWISQAGDWLPVHRERVPARDSLGGNATRDLPTDTVPQTRERELSRGDIVLLATDGFTGPGIPSSPWPAGVPEPADFLRLLAPPDGDDDLSDDRGVVAVWVG